MGTTRESALGRCWLAWLIAAIGIGFAVARPAEANPAASIRTRADAPQPWVLVCMTMPPQAVTQTSEPSHPDSSLLPKSTEEGIPEIAPVVVSEGGKANEGTNEGTNEGGQASPIVFDKTIVQFRLFVAALVAAGMIGMIGTLFCYLRIDHATRGIYSRRLQTVCILLAISILVAIGFAFVKLL